MDFHALQDDARTRTRWMVFALVLAVAVVVVAVNLIGALGWQLFAGDGALPRHFYATNTGVILLYVLGGGWLEWQRLAAGGSAVMLRLGARNPDPYSIRERQFVNVAEEMAISSGLPVPELFVLDHDSINAMVAGHDPAHAALLVTRGALEQLNRTELQGVVAHEFAHLINGDAALNTRLAGALYGLYSLHLLGSGMFGYGGAGLYRQDRRAAGLASPLLLGMGVILLVVGWLGAQAARLVQAGVSRQREFLADAQAVQFTRDRDGIGRALRKVAGQQQPPIENGYAEVLAHFWLARPDLDGWFDTHPPLVSRIRRLYGRPLPAIAPRPEPSSASSGQADRIAPVSDTLPPLAFHRSTPPGNGTGRSRDRAVNDAAREGEAGSCPAHLTTTRLLAESGAADAPAAVLVAAVRDPHPRLSRAALLLNALVAGPAGPAADEAPSDPVLGDALRWLESDQAQWLRIPLLELLTARLRHWPLESRSTLVRYCRDAVLADGRIERIEWITLTLVRHRLLPEQEAVSRVIQPLERSSALAAIFAMAGHLADRSPRRVHQALAEVAAEIGHPRPAQIPEEVEHDTLDDALDVLRTLPPLRKPAVLLSLERLAPDENPALYRAFTTAVAAAIDCPPVRTGAVQNGAGQPSAAHTVS